MYPSDVRGTTVQFTGIFRKIRKYFQPGLDREFLKAVAEERMTPELLKDALKKGVNINARDASGSTALHIAIAAPHHKDNQHLLGMALIEAGADLTIKDNNGNTPLHIAIPNGWFCIIESLVAKGANINSRNHDYRTPLSLAAHNRAITELLLKRGAELDPRDKQIPMLVETLVSFLDDNGPLLEYLLNKKFVALPISVKRDNSNYPLFVWAARKRQYALMQVLLNHGESVDQRTSDGATALYYAAANNDGGLIRSLLSLGANPNIATIYGHTPIDVALNRPKFEAITAFASVKDRLPALAQELLSLVEVVEATKKDDPNVLHDFLKKGTASPLFTKWAWKPRYFQEILMKIKEIEWANDSYHAKQTKIRGWHPLEAEMLLLLSNPKLIIPSNPSASQKNTEVLTRAVTSPYRLFKNVSGEILQSWQRIGLLTHRFLAWKYDAMGGKESLLAKYGFEVVQHPADQQKYGNPSFILEKKPYGLVVLRRGYLLISNPDSGTLVIRNSSPVFGRGLMLHTAYYSPVAVSKKEILPLDPTNDSRFRSVLDPVFYEGEGTSFSTKLANLTTALTTFTQEYGRWKFDHQAFIQHPTPDFMGHKLNGFQALIGFLEDLQFCKEAGIQAPPLPDLAFISPLYPPYFPFPFQDQQGKEQKRFHLTPAHLQELSAWIREDKYPNPDSDLVRFFQMGINKWGELILLEPDPQTKEIPE